MESSIATTPGPDIAQQTSQSPSQEIDKSNLPIILSILGILGIIFISIPAIYIIVQVLPEIDQLSAQMQVARSTPVMSYAVVGLISLIPITQIYYGLTLISAQKNGVLKAAQKRKAKILIIAGIISAIISIPIVIIFVISPIYNMAGSIR